MLPGVAFTALLLCGVSAVTVPPPTNVIVSCQNLKTTVSWKYSSPQPDTRFRVNVDGSAGQLQNETTEHQYDLSHFVWQSEVQYMGFHFVTVTAVQGDNQSESARSESFSFNHLKTVTKKCLLEFPPVDLTMTGTEATLSFPNPFHFYRELKLAVKRSDASLKLIISTDNGTFEHSCTMKDLTCKHDVMFPDGVEQCVTLTGWLCSRNCIEEVMFNKTGRICVSILDSNLNVHWIFAALMLGIFAFIIVVIAAAIFKMKACTMHAYNPMPNSLENWDKQPQHYAQDATKETYSPVAVTDESLSGSSEDDYKTSKDLGDDDNSSGNSLGFQSSEDYYQENEFLEGSEEEEDKDGEMMSPYDRPQHLQDIGGGEMVKCYTWR
ncbi:hypothetical protein EXN66_Car003757 [Channa argus]|uniref:Fibronectin type-III domain-containing protein n=1 Tax=Channa argus TaxID=215402 RepID=A0A6G1PCV1_CHAAH|nr:hypothetical protein EXN66_Car003757 [Channa argus]